jgi:hypothetical protein
MVEEAAKSSIAEKVHRRLDVSPFRVTFVL